MSKFWQKDGSKSKQEGLQASSETYYASCAWFGESGSI